MGLRLATVTLHHCREPMWRRLLPTDDTLRSEIHLDGKSPLLTLKDSASGSARQKPPRTGNHADTQHNRVRRPDLTGTVSDEPRLLRGLRVMPVAAWAHPLIA